MTKPAIKLTAGWVAAATGGRLIAGDPLRELDGVSIDTRTLAHGALYVAIRGERFDGAEFAGAAIVAGASGVVVPRGRGAALRQPQGGGGECRAPNDRRDQIGLAPEAVVVEVDDTVVALQDLAHAVRMEAATTVVAITGSAGKTTTKEVTAEFLTERYRVMRNRGNFNNHIGLPLSLMELTERPEMAVVEMGMNHAGEISTLVRVSEPDVRVWTNVGAAHLGFFASLDAIAEAKAEILERATGSTLLVANADDQRIVARLPRFAGRVVTFGIDRDADVRATNVIDRGIGGIGARVVTNHGAVDVTTPLLGRRNLANVLAGTAVAVELGVPLEAIRERAAALRPAARRGEVWRFEDGVTLIDDSYNANPSATTGALDVLRGSPARRRIAILGEMLELGDASVALHEEVGRAVGRAGVDHLFVVGGAAAAAMAESAVASGMAKARVEHFATSDEAAERAAALVESGDLVLVKGSRGVATDAVVARLKAGRH